MVRRLSIFLSTIVLLLASTIVRGTSLHAGGGALLGARSSRTESDVPTTQDRGTQTWLVEPNNEAAAESRQSYRSNTGSSSKHLTSRVGSRHQKTKTKSRTDVRRSRPAKSVKRLQKRGTEGDNVFLPQVRQPQNGAIANGRSIRRQKTEDGRSRTPQSGNLYHSPRLSITPMPNASPPARPLKPESTQMSQQRTGTLTQQNLQQLHREHLDSGSRLANYPIEWTANLKTGTTELFSPKLHHSSEPTHEDGQVLASQRPHSYSSLQKDTQGQHRTDFSPPAEGRSKQGGSAEEGSKHTALRSKSSTSDDMSRIPSSRLWWNGDSMKILYSHESLSEQARHRNEMHDLASKRPDDASSLLSNHQSYHSAGPDSIKDQLAYHRQRRTVRKHPGYLRDAMAQPGVERRARARAQQTGQGKHRHQHPDPKDPNTGDYHGMGPYDPAHHGTSQYMHPDAERIGGLIAADAKRKAEAARRNEEKFKTRKDDPHHFANIDNIRPIHASDISSRPANGLLRHRSRGNDHTLGNGHHSTNVDSIRPNAGSHNGDWPANGNVEDRHANKHSDDSKDKGKDRPTNHHGADSKWDKARHKEARAARKVEQERLALKAQKIGLEAKKVAVLEAQNARHVRYAHRAGVAGVVAGSVVGAVALAGGGLAAGDKLGMSKPASSIKEQVEKSRPPPSPSPSPSPTPTPSPSPTPTPPAGPTPNIIKRDLSAVVEKGSWVGTQWVA